MKEDVVISEKSIVNKFFKKSEISSLESLDFQFMDKKKVVVYTPADHVEKLTKVMSKAKAGNIGNYTMCSFRIEGTGTYLPNPKAKPFKGKSGKLSYEDEVRLEMECDEDVLNNVLDAVMENHPYEEIVYEVYDFKIRDSKTDGVVVNLKKKLPYSELLFRINKKITKEDLPERILLKKIAVITNEEDEKYLWKCKMNGIEALISYNKKINLIII